MTNAERRRELEKIRKAHGGQLVPADVLSVAESPKHPLHDDFEWDDTKAAHQHRLWQARHMISVVVIFSDTESEEPTRAYVSLLQDRKTGGGYRAAVEVMCDAGMRNQLLAEAEKDMEGFQVKYRRLTELADVFKAMRVAKRAKAATAVMGRRI